MSYIKVINLIALIVVAVLIIGCSNEITQPQGPRMIVGKIVDFTGMDLAGLKVSINYSQPIPLKKDGSFEIPRAAIPYDLYIINSTNNTCVVYRSLHTLTPVAIAWGSVSNSLHLNQADIVAKFPKVPPGKKGNIKFISNDNCISSGGYISQGDSTTNIQVSWSSSKAEISGSFIFLEFTRSYDGRIVTFDHTGKTDTILRNNVSSVITFDSINSGYDPGTSSVTVDISPIYYPPSARPVIAFMGYPMNNDIDISPSNPMPLGTYAVPRALPFPFKIKFQVYNQGDTGICTSNKWIYLDPEDVKTISNNDCLPLKYPADDTTNVDFNTNFSYDLGNEKGVFMFSCSAYNIPYPQLGIFVITSDTKIQLPLLNLLGMHLPGNTPFFWSMRKFTIFKSIDEFTSQSSYTNTESFTSISYSKGRSFLTKPDTAASSRR